MTAVGSYLALTKPRLLPLVLLTGLPALVLAAGQWPTPRLIGATLLGTAIAAMAANALNSYLERGSDALMERTRTRPLPSGALAPRRALVFGLVLSALGTGMLAAWSGVLAALIALAAILVYVFVYTLWLKPRTPVAVILGGVSGAIVPLIADAAIDGSVGAAGWLLFSIIFVWQPPHFYAISLYRRSDYERAGFPVLADRIGADGTRRRILAWVALLVPLTLVTAAWTELGALYAIAAAGLGGWFLASCVNLLRERSEAAARHVFRVSLVYLLALFAAMLADLTWRGYVA